jgi:hypothetical protein
MDAILQEMFATSSVTVHLLHQIIGYLWQKTRFEILVGNMCENEPSQLCSVAFSKKVFACLGPSSTKRCNRKGSRPCFTARWDESQELSGTVVPRCSWNDRQVGMDMSRETISCTKATLISLFSMIADLVSPKSFLENYGVHKFYQSELEYILNVTATRLSHWQLNMKPKHMACDLSWWKRVVIRMLVWTWMLSG